MSVRKAFSIKDQILKAAKDCGDKPMDGRLISAGVQFHAHLSCMALYWAEASSQTRELNPEYSKYCKGMSDGLLEAQTTFMELVKLEDLAALRAKEIFPEERAIVGKQ